MMMMDDSFTVTLPSNSNMATHPQNRGCDYTVSLNPPINFSSNTLNQDLSWEVALSSMQYTNRFYEIREAISIRVFIVFPNVEASTTVGTSAPPPPPHTVNEYTDGLTEAHIIDMIGVDAIDRRILMKYFAKDEGMDDDGWTVASTKIVIPYGRYVDIDDVYNVVVDKFNAAFGGARYKTRMRVVANDVTGKLMFSILPTTNTLHMYTDKRMVMNTFGLAGTTFDSKQPPVYVLRNRGRQLPLLDSVQSLYVYSDIVKDQHVGDTQAPLLEIVPVQGVPGQRVHYTFTALTYIRVNRALIEKVRIYVCDETGTRVAFPDDVDNVVCRLRFRRIKSSSMSSAW